ncbi:hypothetical protein [Marinifilum caeruleilacunae]|uniref:DUF2116 family Zn-ribbon domain-containing protein n=1 Tax=Marinifilum caeruleilacunae TaxID=2499076 RepID=A0ABX1WXL4_9BACT|nr:hypothetical protein [Marinifilum caeruleilacunae]NOU60819.1 hypothetical protein [Marinifilum caeruleilacunae]
MECEVCNKPIIGKRSDSRYCSISCRNKAYKIRVELRREKELEDSEDTLTAQDLEFLAARQIKAETIQELRSLDREHFNAIMSLKTEYESKIKTLEDTNLKNDFKIERLQDKISDLKEKHAKELTEASTNTTKDTVTAISQMPAIQTALGAFASNVIPIKSEGLSGVEEQISIQERQIVDSIRRMQPDIQENLIQVLYFLFAKNHEEQMQIFRTLQAYFESSNEDEDI